MSCGIVKKNYVCAYNCLVNFGIEYFVQSFTDLYQENIQQWSLTSEIIYIMWTNTVTSDNVSSLP